MLGAVGAAWHPGSPEGETLHFGFAPRFAPQPPGTSRDTRPILYKKAAPELPFAFVVRDGTTAFPASSLAEHV